VAGVLVDRLPRKAVMIASDLIRAVIALGLLLFRGPSTVWVAYACVAGLASFSAFFEPARMSTLPAITSDEELVTANALSSVTWSILFTSGMVIGGIVGHFFGPSTAFVLNGLSFVASATFLSGLQLPATAGAEHATHGFGELAAGFRYVFHHREILGAITAKAGWGLAGGIQVLIPLYGAQLFPLRHDPGGQLSMSLLFAAGGVGTALGPILGRRFTGRDIGRMRWAIAVSFALAALYYAGMALSPNLALAGLFLLLARLHGSIVWVFSTVLLQILTEDRFRGRVFAAEMSLFTVTMMLSSLGTSRALDLKLATVPGMVFAMAGASLVVGIGWLIRLLRMSRSAGAADEASAGRPIQEPE
jgi:MFS family permease